ncbi:uncharacterized protein LOC115789600 [Archocentrus centrarchus]|uniref:uncharacterized protein LOC115789600 n=1 Tax=Archocentrus centrarchus TaxID=63155 RepID=UPI0011EA379A|nr:uncharacterized protein LOC115789600 [Archocentrus centrarchus]XP_030598941.1 uncharacterized protein LOC115789600 [Archocentrus centrarchus]
MSSHPQRRKSMDYPSDFSLSQSSTETEENPGTSEGGHTMTAKISSRFNEIISNSILNHSGPPAVYQLRPKKEKIGTLTRVTVGERNPNKINKTILLLGETGAGKSTLVNALLNYSIGVKFEDEIWFQIVEEEKDEEELDKEEEENLADSQTSDVIVYEIFGFEDQTLPYSLTIIDTPGYGDTREIKQDDIITHRLLDLFGADDGVCEVTAVCLIMKAADNRLTDRLKYVFDAIMSLFGKDVEKNTVALFTYSDGGNPKNALKALRAGRFKCAKNKKDPIYFQFNNKEITERTEERKSTFEAAWRVTEEGMVGFGAFLERSKPQSLMKTLKVLNERVRLKACIQNLTERIELSEEKQREFEQTEEALKKYDGKMQKNKNFTVEVDEVYKAKEEIDSGRRFLIFYKAATCCTVCQENCHYPGCTKAWNPESCEVMKDGHCTVCTGKCPVSAHVKEEWRYVIKTRRVQNTLEEIKEKFEKNKSESEKKSSLLENIKKEMNQLRAEKKQFLDECYHHVLRLEQIALKADSASTVFYLDFLIEKMKEERDTEKVQKLEEMRSLVSEGTLAAVKYKFGKMFKK